MNGVFLCEKRFILYLCLEKANLREFCFTKCHFARTRETNIPIYRKKVILLLLIYSMVYFTNVRMYIKIIEEKND